MPPLSIYLHIPFCTTRCSYCDFNTYTGLEDWIPEYVEALRKDILRWGAYLKKPDVHTVFFGGGTPSLLSAPQVQSIMDALRSVFNIIEGAEVTLEANPGDCSLAHFQRLYQVGITRLSMGIQTFDDAALRALGRRHSAQLAREAVSIAKQAGFESVNFDLIYSLPGQTMDGWRKNLDEALSLRPAHISMYALTLEEDTPMWRDVNRGKLPAPDPDLAADMYELARETLARAGYSHYEISNWAFEGKECRHNLTYWKNLPYIGLGPGAHSSFRDHRFSVIRIPQEYGKWKPEIALGTFPESLKSLSPIDYIEHIDKPLEQAETAILGLRLVKDGVSKTDFAARFGEQVWIELLRKVQVPKEMGLISLDGERLKLTSKGLLLSNEVFWRLLPENAGLTSAIKGLNISPA
ncbi:MAG: radical SAM family heme chaperone HemW [Dehalococcoidia bacterium]|nr:radical SAM family heme chaperone HemW [Dehalococcoidia bacterium]